MQFLIFQLLRYFPPSFLLAQSRSFIESQHLSIVKFVINNAFTFPLCWVLEHEISDLNRLIRRFKTKNKLATKWLRILPLGGIDKIRNHLVANPINVYISFTVRCICMLKNFMYVLLYDICTYVHAERNKERTSIWSSASMTRVLP